RLGHRLGRHLRRPGLARPGRGRESLRPARAAHRPALLRAPGGAPRALAGAHARIAAIPGARGDGRPDAPRVRGTALRAVGRPGVAPMRRGGVGDEADEYRYEGAVPCDQAGRYGFAVRVVPSHPDLTSFAELGSVAWA